LKTEGGVLALSQYRDTKNKRNKGGGGGKNERKQKENNHPVHGGRKMVRRKKTAKGKRAERSLSGGDWRTLGFLRGGKRGG